jgi:hypothetical protein
MTTGGSLSGGIGSFYPAWLGQPGSFAEVRAGHDAAVAQAGAGWFTRQVFTQREMPMPGHPISGLSARESHSSCAIAYNVAAVGLLTQRVQWFSQREVRILGPTTAFLNLCFVFSWSVLASSPWSGQVSFQNDHANL